MTQEAYSAFYEKLAVELRKFAQFPLRLKQFKRPEGYVVASLPQGGPEQARFQFSFVRRPYPRFRCELAINSHRPDARENKRLFDSLFAHRTDIEASIGEPLSWERLDDRQHSQVCLYHAGVDSVEQSAELLEALRRWAVPAMNRFYGALEPWLSQAFGTKVSRGGRQPRPKPRKATPAETKAATPSKYFRRIAALEKQLRTMIATRLSRAFGDLSWDHVPGEVRRSVQGRVDQRVRDNPYLARQYATVSNRLELCQFSDYAKIVKANWALFQDVFGGDQNHFDHRYQDATAGRNAVIHQHRLPKADQLAAEGGLVWLEECLQNQTLASGDRLRDDTQ